MAAQLRNGQQDLLSIGSNEWLIREHAKLEFSGEPRSEVRLVIDPTSPEA